MISVARRGLRQGLLGIPGGSRQTDDGQLGPWSRPDISPPPRGASSRHGLVHQALTRQVSQEMSGCHYFVFCNHPVNLITLAARSQDQDHSRHRRRPRVCEDRGGVEGGQPGGDHREPRDPRAGHGGHGGHRR